MNRIILALIVTSVSLFSVVGCTNKTSNENTFKTVSVWTPHSHSKDIMDAEVEKYNSTVGASKGIKVQYVVREGNLSETIELAFFSDQAPDLFALTDFEKQIAGNRILPIDELVGGAQYLEKYKGYIENRGFTINGKTYTVPQGSSTLGLIYNKDLFRKAGIVDDKGEPTPPKTYSEVREYAKRITELGDMVYGIAIPLKWSGWFGCDVLSGSLQEIGRKMYEPTTGTYKFDEYKPVLEMYMGIKADKSYFPGAEGLDNDPARAQFAEGRIGMKFAGSWDVGVLNDQFPAKCDWDVAPLPASIEKPLYAQYGDKEGSFLINKSSVNTAGIEALTEVFKFLTGDEMTRILYREGKLIPYDFDIVKDVKINNPKTGWEGFAKLSSIGMSPFMDPKIIINGKDFGTVFIEDVWTEKVSIDSAIKDLNFRYNEALKDMIKNGQINIDEYIDENWSMLLNN